MVSTFTGMAFGHQLSDSSGAESFDGLMVNWLTVM